MKLKYKKIILLTTMSTMGIGLLTLSISHDNTKVQDKDSLTALEAGILTDETYTEDEATDLAAGEQVQSFAAMDIDPTPTPEPTPTPLPVYDLEEAPNPEIQTLLEKYMDAKASADRETLLTLWSDPARVESQEKLQENTDYIEEYTNIQTYVKKGIEEGTYIVYVYHEAKLISINTSAPSLAKYYVITAPDNTLKLYNGDFTEEMREYIDARNEDQDVIDLGKLTDERSEEAKAKDEDLKIFWEYMKSLVEGDSSDVEGDAE